MKCFECGYNGGHHPMCGIQGSERAVTSLSEERNRLRSVLINLIAGVKEQGLEQWLEPQLADAAVALNPAKTEAKTS